MIDVKKVLSAIVDKFQQKPVLLWTNPNPSASFSGQDIVLNLDSYNSVLIYCKNDRNYFSARVEKGMGITFRDLYTYTADYVRYFSVQTNKIVVGACEGDGSSNTRLIPYKIYGIK